VPARRFFVRDCHDVGERVSIEGADARKIVHVLRLRSGDRIDVVDSAAQVFSCVLSIDGALVSATLMARTAAHDDAAGPRIDIAQAVPKGSKMDYVVEKLSEVGVRALLPLKSERVVGDVTAAKLDRWRRLAKSAAAQSGRSSIMTVSDACSFAGLLEQFHGYGTVLMPWEAAEPRPPAQVLPELVYGVKSALVLIGPEGGFSHEEAAAAERFGAHLVSLGSQILRTETAGLVTAAILRYEWGR
jgi:16S rRNA (uracil1498-N3)-methyltransferase